jgi:hypothetical protein
MNKKFLFFPVLLVILAIIFSFGIVLAQAKPDEQNPSSDIERGVFVHYPHANGLAKGAGATGELVNDFKYSGIHWPGVKPGIHYSVNPANDWNLSGHDVVNTTKAAFQEWMDENIKDSRYITFIYDDVTTTNTPVNPSRDNTNTVSFEPLNEAYPNAIAITFYWYYRGSKELVETDTVFNNDLPWSVTDESTKYDLQNIATHEFGHWLLLGDLYSLRDSALTMYGYGYLGETDKSTLGKGDISGINRIY